MSGHKTIDAVFKPKNDRFISAAETRCGVEHALQDRLKVELGADDDAQQVGGCSPLLPRLIPLASKPRDPCFLAGR